MNFFEGHAERCRDVRERRGTLGSAVRKLRTRLGDQTAKMQNAILERVRSEEQDLFREYATDAIDAVIRGDTKASGLEINEQLVNFVALATPNIRLRARAGSGKSTAIVIKCVFLIRALHMAPETLQILTFNRAAAEHLREKLRAALGEEVAARIGVNTFHSLAVSVVKGCPDTQDMDIVFSKREAKDEGRRLSAEDLERLALSWRLFQQALNEMMTTRQELEPYRTTYQRSAFRNMVDKDDFENKVKKYVEGAVDLYRARRGVMPDTSTSRIRPHIARVADAYEAKLATHNMLDGEACLRRAAAILSDADAPLRPERLDGQLQYLFVDEYQDFSSAFEGLTQALMSRNPDCVLNAVGDDWQSINAFMGADLSFFEGFRKNYPPALNLDLRANFRSGKRIVALGNAVMAADERSAAVAAEPHDGKLRIAPEGEIVTEGRGNQWHRDARDYISARLEKIADQAWADDARAGRKPGSLVLLAFANNPYGQSLPDYAQDLRGNPDGTVETSTVSSAKGREWDHVILLDGIVTEYPNSHPADPIQQTMISTQEKTAQGRRLLYVAVTRAKHSLAILVPTELHPDLSMDHAVS